MTQEETDLTETLNSQSGCIKPCLGCYLNLALLLVQRKWLQSCMYISSGGGYLILFKRKRLAIITWELFATYKKDKSNTCLVIIKRLSPGNNPVLNVKLFLHDLSWTENKWEKAEAQIEFLILKTSPSPLVWLYFLLFQLVYSPAVVWDLS